MTTTFANRIVETSSTTGTGTLSLNGARAPYLTFRQGYADGNAKTPVLVLNSGRTKWELSRNSTLTYGTPDTLTRNVVLSNNSNAAWSWTADDLPLTVLVPTDAAALELAITGNAGTSRHALLRDGALWPDTTNGWSGRVPFKLNPSGTECEAGAWEGSRGIWLPSRNTLVLANGAANLTITTNHAGWLVSFDNSAAARTANLPALSSVPDGFPVGVYGLSQANFISLAPAGSDVIDFGSGGRALPLPGKCVVWIYADKSGTAQWRTNFDYSVFHTIAIANPSNASTTDFTALPYWANDLRVDISLSPSNNDRQILMRAANSLGIFDSGPSDYAYNLLGFDTTNTSSFQSLTASGYYLCYQNLTNSNNYNLRGLIQMNDIRNASQCSAAIVDTTGINAANNGTQLKLQGWRLKADIVTGLRFLATEGNHSGRIKLECSA